MQLVAVVLALTAGCGEQDSSRIDDLLATTDCRYELPAVEPNIEWPPPETCLPEPACACCCEPEPLREGEIQFIVSLPDTARENSDVHPAQRWVQRFQVGLVGLWLVVVVGEILFWRTARHVGWRPSHVCGPPMDFPRVTSSFPPDPRGVRSF